MFSLKKILLILSIVLMNHSLLAIDKKIARVTCIETDLDGNFLDRMLVLDSVPESELDVTPASYPSADKLTDSTDKELVSATFRHRVFDIKGVKFDFSRTDDGSLKGEIDGFVSGTNPIKNGEFSEFQGRMIKIKGKYRFENESEGVATFWDTIYLKDIPYMREGKRTLLFTCLKPYKTDLVEEKVAESNFGISEEEYAELADDSVVTGT